MRILLVSGLCFSLLGCAATMPPVQEETTAVTVQEKSEPKAVITGEVKANGQPVKGMLVEAYTVNCFEGAVAGKTYTGAKGEFRFKHMKPDTYFIGLNDFRGPGKQLPTYTSNCGQGRVFNGKDDLYIQVPVKLR